MDKNKDEPTPKMKPVPDDAFTASRQLKLFQSVFANDVDQRSDVSHAIELWDSVPRYSISKSRMNSLRTEQGFLESIELPFRHRGESFIAVIHPARIKTKSGERKSHYPSAREELIEHALRKLATEQNQGFFDKQASRSGIRFSLYQLRQELKERGHEMRYDELTEGLDILNLSSIEIKVENSVGGQGFARSNYLPGLAGVRRDDYDADRSARWVAQFHPMVTHSIDKITYRQFNYQRLMECKSQLARWLLNQLVLKYVAASPLNTFEMRFSTIRRDSALLDGYSRDRAAIEALDSAWRELEKLGALSSVTKTDERGARAKLLDVAYKIHPSHKFIAEQKAANRRQNDAKETPGGLTQESDAHQSMEGRGRIAQAIERGAASRRGSAPPSDRGE